MIQLKSVYSGNKLVAIALLLFLPPPLITAQDSYELAWKFESGQRFDFELSQTSELETEVETVANTIKTTNSVKFHWEVKKVNDDGEAEIVMVFDQMKIDVQLPTPKGSRSFIIDSDSEAGKKPDEFESEMRANIDAVIGSEIKLTVSARGELMHLELPDSAKAKLRDAPQSMQIRQLVTENGIKELLGSSRMVLPDEPINKGHVWTIAEDFSNSIGTFERQQILTFAGIFPRKSEDLAKITVETKLIPKTPNDETGTNAKKDTDSAGQLPAVEVRSQAGTGTIWFDNDQGFLKAAEIDIQLVTQTPYRDMKINIQMTSRIKLEVFRIAK